MSISPLSIFIFPLSIFIFPLSISTFPLYSRTGLTGIRIWEKKEKERQNKFSYMSFRPSVYRQAKFTVWFRIITKASCLSLTLVLAHQPHPLTKRKKTKENLKIRRKYIRIIENHFKALSSTMHSILHKICIKSFTIKY